MVRSRALSSLSSLVLFLLMLASCGGESTAERSMVDPATVNAGEVSGGDTRRMVVYGMSCPLCATNVDKQLLKLPGVRKVNVNLDTGVILVDVDRDNAPTTEQITRAVVDSGFTLQSIDE